jgi:hypothetical protein
MKNWKKIKRKWALLTQNTRIFTFTDLFLFLRLNTTHFVHWLTALRFTAAGAPLAARRIRILPMNQHA